jgi:hypothetical protein
MGRVFGRVRRFPDLGRPSVRGRRAGHQACSADWPFGRPSAPCPVDRAASACLAGRQGTASVERSPPVPAGHDRWPVHRAGPYPAVLGRAAWRRLPARRGEGSRATPGDNPAGLLAAPPADAAGVELTAHDRRRFAPRGSGVARLPGAGPGARVGPPRRRGAGYPSSPPPRGTVLRIEPSAAAHESQVCRVFSELRRRFDAHPGVRLFPDPANRPRNGLTSSGRPRSTGPLAGVGSRQRCRGSWCDRSCGQLQPREPSAVTALLPIPSTSQSTWRSASTAEHRQRRSDSGSGSRRRIGRRGWDAEGPAAVMPPPPRSTQRLLRSRSSRATSSRSTGKARRSLSRPAVSLLRTMSRSDASRICTPRSSISNASRRRSS